MGHHHVHGKKIQTTGFSQSSLSPPSQPPRTLSYGLCPRGGAEPKRENVPLGGLPLPWLSGTQGGRNRVSHPDYPWRYSEGSPEYQSPRIC